MIKELTTESRILDKAIELFYRHGIKGITMDDISRALGISKKTIYETYSDKDEIVNSVTARELKNQDRDCNSISKNAVNAVDEIFKLMDMLGKYFSKINPHMFYDLQRYHPRAWEQFRKFKEENLVLMLEDNFKKGIKQELYRADLKIKILARLRMEEVEMGFDTNVFPPDKFHVRDVQLVLLDHFVHGIVTLKGHKLINKYKKMKEEE